LELEGLLNGNPILLYFVGIFYILINENFEKSQKIIVVYMLSYCLRLFDIIEFKTIIIVLNIVAFLYLEFLTKDNIKNKILNNIWDKIKDYIYKVIFEFSGVYFLISITIINYNFVPQIQFFSINIPIANIISIMLIMYTFNNIISEKYATLAFSQIKKRMDNITIWTKIPKISEENKEKLNMLVDIEDKSYFIRESSYNFLSLEFFTYKMYKKTVKKENIKYNLKRKQIINYIKKFFRDLLDIDNFFHKISKYVRGYSTIEMQLIRTLGIQYGYNFVIYRKIYELMYSKIFFKNLLKYMNKAYLNTKGCCTFKEYLLNIYINVASIRINDKDFKYMLQIWNTKKLEDVSKEQFLISILGLSRRKIDNEIIYNYGSIIEKYNIDIEKLNEIIRNINV